MKIDNNWIEQIGIGIFSEQWNAGPLSDITFTRNYLYSSLDDMAGGPTLNGLYYPKRQHFELKEGTRIRIRQHLRRELGGSRALRRLYSLHPACGVLPRLCDRRLHHQ